MGFGMIVEHRERNFLLYRRSQDPVQCTDNVRVDTSNVTRDCLDILHIFAPPYVVE